MSAEPTVKDMLELCVAIELECAAVYDVLAKQYAHNEELAVFWRLYAEAERYHAATIRIHQHSFGTDEMASERALETDVVETRAFLQQLRDWRDQFAGGNAPLAEAFGVAQQIEDSTAELHGRTQFFKGYPSFAELFKQMMDDDLEHRDMLGEAMTRFAS
jgi:hypothetical protein